MSMSPDEIAQAWRRELPDAPTRSIPVASAIKRAGRLLQRNRERVLHDLGVDAATLDLLSTLRRAGPPYTLSTRQLAEQALVTAGAISQRIARAEERDLVRRRPAAQGRTVLVELTASGHALIERVVDRVLAADEAATAPLSDEDMERIQELLSRLSL